MVTSKSFFIKTNDKKWSKYELIKTFLMSITGISIVRFILFSVFFVLLALSLSVTHSLHDSKFKKFICFFNQILSRSCLFILGYYYINETFVDNDYNNIVDYFTYYNGQDKPKMIIYNHVSVLDSLYFISRGDYYFMVTTGLLKYPLLGKVLENIGAIFVPRNKEEKNIFPNPNTVIESNIKKSLKPVLIAPEGATHQNDYLYNFQLGPFRPMVPIRPVILDYKFKHADPSWTYSCSPIYTIFRLCCQFINYLDVKNLPIQKPTENETPELFRDRVEKLYLESNLKFIKVDLSVNDSHYFGKKYNENPEMAIYIYDNIITKSISKYTDEEKLEIENIFRNKKVN